jgi:hypothetical protein
MATRERLIALSADEAFLVPLSPKSFHVCAHNSLYQRDQSNLENGNEGKREGRCLMALGALVLADFLEAEVTIRD